MKLISHISFSIFWCELRLFYIRINHVCINTQRVAISFYADIVRISIVVHFVLQVIYVHFVRIYALQG